jgi:hypothetical protein
LPYSFLSGRSFTLTAPRRGSSGSGSGSPCSVLSSFRLSTVPRIVLPGISSGARSPWAYGSGQLLIGAPHPSEIRTLTDGLSQIRPVAGLAVPSVIGFGTKRRAGPEDPGPRVDQTGLRPISSLHRPGLPGGLRSRELASATGVHRRATFVPCRKDNCGHRQSLKSTTNGL